MGQAHRDDTRIQLSGPTYPAKRVCNADDLTVWASGDNRVPEGQLIVDFLPKVLSHIAHPGHTTSQDPPAGPMSQDIGGLDRPLPIIQHSQYTSESIKQK